MMGRQRFGTESAGEYGRCREDSDFEQDLTGRGYAERE
jgi:hypothetical protein